jgi:LPS-assembly protein
VFIEADTVIDDRDNKTITAEGGVEARYQGRTLRADQLVYNTVDGTARAHGHAVILNADGTSQYAEDIELDDEMRAGVATAFSAKMTGNVSLTAGAAIRRSETISQLNSAIYTVCDTCKKDGDPKTPTWSVQASRIILDQDHHLVYYRNAIIRVKGIPLIYTPIFWHADPTAERQSGLLSPRFRINGQQGFTYEQPFFWSISPSAYATLSPQFSTQVAPLLNADLRKRFYTGEIDVRAGYTYEKRFDKDGRFGDKASRAYILALGKFEPTDKWTYGFGVERVSDDTLFTRYHVEDLYQNRGIYTVDTERLISQLYTYRQDRTSFLQMSTVDFQSLRVVQVNRQLISYDSPDAFPLVAPMIEARVNPETPILGGRLRMLANAVVLTRDQALSKVTTPGLQQNQLVDSRRASARADWRANFTFANGLRVEPFAQARADLYSVDTPAGADALYTAASLTAPKNGTFGRSLATAGADISMPFFRQFGRTSVVFEPLAQLVASPNVDPNKNLPNEDSRAFNFDTTNLFTLNRFPGFDEYESGVRMNVGGRVSAKWGRGDASFLVGRTIRTEPDLIFTKQSGLSGTLSDWVTAATLTPIPGIRMFSRTRLDSDTLKVKREDAGLDVGFSRLSGSARYQFNDQDVTGVQQQSLSLGATAFVTRNWGLGINTTRDLQAKIWPVTQFSLIYRDECIRIDVVYTHDATIHSNITPSNSITIRLNLATLGGTRQ